MSLLVCTVSIVGLTLAIAAVLDLYEVTHGRVLRALEARRRARLRRDLMRALPAVRVYRPIKYRVSRALWRGDRKMS